MRSFRRRVAEHVCVFDTATGIFPTEHNKIHILCKFSGCTKFFECFMLNYNQFVAEQQSDLVKKQSKWRKMHQSNKTLHVTSPALASGKWSKLPGASPISVGLVCKQCGAWVPDAFTEKHENWHARLCVAVAWEDGLI